MRILAGTLISILASASACTPDPGSSRDERSERPDLVTGENPEEWPDDIPFVPNKKPRPEVLLLAEDYDHSCEVHEDCILVFEGDYCQCRLCNNATIAAEAAAEFQADIVSSEEKCGELEVACGSLEFWTVTHRQASSCTDAYALCIDFTCTAVLANDLRELPHACETDDDCVSVPWSMDHDCVCQSATTQEGYYLATEIRKQRGSPSNPEGTCDCDDVGPARCLNGRCSPSDVDPARECPIITWDPTSCR